MSFVSQIYGLSLFLLGVLILIWPRQESQCGLLKGMWLLATFAFTHAAAAWIEPGGSDYLTQSFVSFIRSLSYVFLFELGRRLIRIHYREGSLLRALFSPWIYTLALPVFLFASASGADADARLAQHPAALLGAGAAALGLLLYWHNTVKTLPFDDDHARIKFAIHVLSLSLLAYGMLDAMAASPAAWGWARLDTVNVPGVQGALAAVAAMMAASAISMLKILDLQARHRVIEANAAAERDKESLRRASCQNELLLRTASDGIHVLDTEGNVVEANDSFCRMLGYTREEILRMNVREWDAHFSPEELKERVPRLIGNRTVFETRHRRRDGKIFDVEISTVGVYIDGKPLLYCSSRDITDRKHAEEQLQLIARAFDRAAEGVMITDDKQKILTVNESFTTVTGYTREEVVGKTPSILQSGKQSPGFYKKMWEDLNSQGWWQGEIWNRRKNGELYLEWLSINAVRDAEGKVINYLGMFSDITLIKQSRRRMEFLATHDELTGLPNRALFNDHLRLAVARSARAGTRFALLFVDLDNFKMINDTLGHEEGDMLLKEVAERLKGCVREVDTVARLGGDEFVVLLEIDQRNEAGYMAERILNAFGDSFMLQGQECFISSSIGISLFPEDASEPKILMRHADTAMYRAKEHGKNAYMFFTEEMAEQISRRMLIENSLRLAIPHNELFLEYQPQISLTDNALTGVEALLRWRHQDEIILPQVFVHAAEESGFIAEIDEWVIGEVCRQMREWDEAGLPRFIVSINVSTRHFRRPDIFSRIMNAIAGANISPQRLCFEITEGVLMDVERAGPVLQQLHEAGYRISVDDFGTGFSSLSYLKRFPIDEVKVDRSFVDGIAVDADDRAITTAIIALAQGLGLRTVAEGVESGVQREILRSLGCEAGQGFFYSEPLSAGMLSEWMRSRHAGSDHVRLVTPLN